MNAGNIPVDRVPPDLGEAVQVAAAGVLASLGAIRAANEKTGLARVGDQPVFSGLAWLYNHPEHELMQEIETDCSQACGEKVTCKRLFAGQTACDACRKKWEEAAQLDRAKKHWEMICPEGFRDTNKGHEDFPKAQYEQTKAWAGESSLFLYGEPRTGKTRLAMLLLKRALLRGKWVGVLWPWDFAAIKNSRDTLEKLKEYGAYDVLLLDDVLLSGARDERLSGWLKELLEYMIQRKRQWILTSNVGGDDYLEQAKKFSDDGKLSASDEARIKALLGRLRENSTVVPFAKAVAAAGESVF
jgi:DNA replication protein DnaC